MKEVPSFPPFSFRLGGSPRNLGVSFANWPASCPFILGLQSRTPELSVRGFTFMCTCGDVIAQLHGCLGVHVGLLPRLQTRTYTHRDPCPWMSHGASDSPRPRLGLSPAPGPARPGHRADWHSGREWDRGYSFPRDSPASMPTPWLSASVSLPSFDGGHVARSRADWGTWCRPLRQTDAVSPWPR